jgi:hypothetical protein
MKQFIKELKKRNGHVLDTIKTSKGYLLYYREYGTYSYNTQLISFKKN